MSCININHLKTVLQKNMKSLIIRVLTTCACGLGLLFAVVVPVQAAGSNALDRINFGDTGTDAYSESVHSFNSGLSGSPLAGTGAYGQTYRAPLGGGPGKTI
jgi:hypothetical protein